MAIANWCEGRTSGGVLGLDQAGDYLRQQAVTEELQAILRAPR